MTQQATKQNKEKLVMASANDLHIAPRKMRLVTNLIKNLPVEQALVQLQHTNKKASEMVIKLLKSAVANAQNNFSLKPENLYVKSLTCDMGRMLKRYMPRARGSAFTIRRKMSHVNIVLGERAVKGKKSAFNLFKKEKEQDKPENVDQEVATNEKPVKDTTKKSQVGKTDEQKKMNTIANKRRLFNRKTGV
jgi:large subunit ribosomal protein L22